MTTKKFKLVNLMPHPITIHWPDREGAFFTMTQSFEPDGHVARMIPHEWQESPRIESPEESGFGIPVKEHQSLSGYRIDKLPDPQPDTIYLVSLLCLDAAQQQKRADVYAPDTGPDSGCERDEHGQITAVRRLVRAYTPTRR